MKGVSVSTVLAVVGALWIGSYLAPDQPPIYETRVDTVAPAALLDSVRALRLESSGLRAMLAGRGEVQPRTILRTDTLVTPPDTVLQIVAMDGNGNLTLAPLIRADSLWAPEIHRFDVGNCDDGWSWASGQLVCDKARLGHLSPFVSAGVRSSVVRFTPDPLLSAGLEWTPSYRSAWRASVGMDQTGRVSLALNLKWNAF